MEARCPHRNRARNIEFVSLQHITHKAAEANLTILDLSKHHAVAKYSDLFSEELQKLSTIVDG
ncbi:hypothetical protein GJV44_00036 [Candidatus Vallotia cooleyia]|nr:hypothetical protein GJV44_00036 [Candidatus Vallotia cooleyia]